MGELTETAPKPRRRHGVKIREAVTDHVPRPHVWHVLECSCGWSSALHETHEGATLAWEQHKRAWPKRRRL